MFGFLRKFCGNRRKHHRRCNLLLLDYTLHKYKFFLIGHTSPEFQIQKKRFYYLNTDTQNWFRNGGYGEYMLRTSELRTDKTDRRKGADKELSTGRRHSGIEFVN